TLNNFNGAILTLMRNGAAAAEDVFSATGTLTLSSGNVLVSGTTIGTYTNSGGVLVFTFNSNATLNLVNAAMRQIAYSNSSDAPPVSAQINWIFNDGNTSIQGSGGALQASGSTTVTITAVNDDPTNAGSIPSAVTVTEDVLSSINLAALDFSDLDAGSTNLTVTLSTSTGGELTLAADASLTFGGSANARTLTGTLTDLNNYFNNASNIQYLHATSHTFGNNDDTITVLINDNGNTGSGGGSNQLIGSISVDITAVNDAPVVGTNTGATVAEGAAVTITTAMLNDADVDDSGSGLTYTVTRAPSHGQLELTTNAGVAITTFTQDDIDNNRVIFVHDGSQTASDNVDFSLADGGEDGVSAATGTFTISVTNVNDAPVNTVPGAQVVNEDTALALSAITVSDDDNNLSTVQLSVNHGTLKLTLSAGATIFSGANESGDVTLSGSIAAINATLTSLSYQGHLHFTGSDTLTILSTDSNAVTDSDTVAIIVNQVNDIGMFSGDASTTNEDTPTFGTVTFIDFADSVTAPNFTLNTAASNGIAVIDSNGNWTYTPNANFNGLDDFTVQAIDADGNQESHVISITVSAVADLIAADDSHTLAEDTLLSSNVSDNDSTTSGGGLTYSLVSNASHGNLNFHANGSYTYQGHSHVNGSDSFTYTVLDISAGESKTQTVNLIISPVNDAGVFSGDTSTTTNEDTQTFGTVTFIDLADGDTAPNFTLNTAPSNGIAAIDTNGNWTYTPNANFHGIDSFIVEASDDQGETAMQVVAITLNSVNDTASFGGAFSGAVIEDVDPDVDTLLEITGELTVIDPDSGESSFIPQTINGSYGDLTINSAGVWFYTAQNANPDIQILNSNDFLNDTFTVTSFDGTTQEMIITIIGSDADPAIIVPAPASPESNTPEPQPKTPQPQAPQPQAPQPKTPELVSPEVDKPVDNTAITDQTTGNDIDENIGNLSSLTSSSPASSSLPTPLVTNDVFLSVLANRQTPYHTAEEIKPTAEATQTFLQELASFWKEDGLTEITETGRNSPEFIIDINRMLLDLDKASEIDNKNTELSTEAITGVSITLTAGFVSWALRAGSLMASFLAVMPAWRNLDPMPILAADEKSHQKSSTDDPKELTDKETETKVDEFFDR
ncbi:MAG: Ig-like domain-containing protein, partial [Shewanella sp.]